MLGAFVAGYPAVQVSKALMAADRRLASAIRAATVAQVDAGMLDPACLVAWDVFVVDLVDAADRARLAACPPMSAPAVDLLADSITTAVAADVFGLSGRHWRRLASRGTVRGRFTSGRWLVDPVACKEYRGLK